MRKFFLYAFAAALFAAGFAGSASAEPGWGWGECSGGKTLTVENPTLDESIAEGDGKQSTKQAD